MDKYIKQIKISMQNAITYNRNYILSALINVFSILITIFLWNAIFKSKNEIGSYNIITMVLYIFVVNTFSSIINVSNMAFRLSEDFRTGLLNVWLIRPYPHFFAQLSDICGIKITNIPITILLNASVGLLYLFFTHSKRLM